MRRVEARYEWRVGAARSRVAKSAEAAAAIQPHSRSGKPRRRDASCSGSSDNAGATMNLDARVAQCSRVAQCRNVTDASGSMRRGEIHSPRYLCETAFLSKNRPKILSPSGRRGRGPASPCVTTSFEEFKMPTVTLANSKLTSNVAPVHENAEATESAETTIP